MGRVHFMYPSKRWYLIDSHSHNLGGKWSAKSAWFWSGNLSVVYLLNSGSSREEQLIHLMWCLVFLTAKYNFVVSAFHVKDCCNDLVDALSHNKQS